MSRQVPASEAEEWEEPVQGRGGPRHLRRLFLQGQTPTHHCYFRILEFWNIFSEPIILSKLYRLKFVVIEVELDTKGCPKGAVKGNCMCWLGALEFCCKDVIDTSMKLLTNYNVRGRKFGRQNVSKRVVQTAFSKYCAIVGIQRDESINNMWAKKSFANTTLGVMQLPIEMVMATTGHRSELTCREYYCQVSLN